MHNVDTDVRTTEPKELISEAGSAESVEAAMERAGSWSDDGAGGTTISAMVPRGMTGCTAVVKGSVEN
jgi:hypothetical protein